MIIKKPFDLEKALAGEPVVMEIALTGKKIKVIEVLEFKKRPKNHEVNYPVFTMDEFGNFYNFDKTGWCEGSRQLFMMQEHPNIEKLDVWRNKETSNTHRVVCVSVEPEGDCVILSQLTSRAGSDPIPNKSKRCRVLDGVPISIFYDEFELVERGEG